LKVEDLSSFSLVEKERFRVHDTGIRVCDSARKGTHCEDRVLYGPASGKKAPRVGPVCIVILARE